MIRRLSERQLPMPPSTDTGVLAFCRGLVGWARQFSFDVIGQLNSQVQGVGSSISVTGSNQTLKPTDPIHSVGGTGSIQYIQPPTEQLGVEADLTTQRSISSFTGPLFFLPTGLWTLVDTGTGTGRIAKASSAVVGQLMILVFDGDKWTPSY